MSMIESLGDYNNKKNISYLVAVIVLGGLLTAFNMFKFPYYESDEGTYMSQAWSVVKQGSFSPYTYNYDHAPLGWLVIALWSKLIGGFFTFGFSINSGRVLMLLFRILTMFVVFLVATRLGMRRINSILSVLFFSVSPIAIYFGRRVLLDNMLVLWVLASVYLLLTYRLGKVAYILSGFLFGLAILTKESALAFFPGFLYLILDLNKKDSAKTHLRVSWILGLVIPLSFYFFYALFRNELFPHDGVSLIGTFLEQTSRGKYNIFDLKNNVFLITLKEWFIEDPVFILAGLLSLVISIFSSFKNYTSRVISIFSVSYLIFLMRGGVVFEFYILPILPWLALSFGNVIEQLFSKTHATRIAVSIIVLALVGIQIFYYSYNIKDNRSLYLSDQTTPQIEAVSWLLTNTPNDSKTLVDNYSYLDLNERNMKPGRIFEYYWKAEKDPQIRNNVFMDDPSNVTFLAVTPQMLADTKDSNNTPFVTSAINNSNKIIRFEKDGWYVEIRENQSRKK